jgi:hypothetical protein
MTATKMYKSAPPRDAVYGGAVTSEGLSPSSPSLDRRVDVYLRRDGRADFTMHHLNTSGSFRTGWTAVLTSSMRIQ